LVPLRIILQPKLRGKVRINFFAGYLTLQGKVTSLQKDYAKCEEITILAYVLFKVESGTEKDVAERLSLPRRERCYSKGYD